MRLLCSRRQLNCEATPSSNVGVISSATPSSNVGVPSSNVEGISSSHVEETLICRSDDIHTPSCHVESTTSTHQVGDIPSFTSYYIKMLRELKRLEHLLEFILEDQNILLILILTF